MCTFFPKGMYFDLDYNPIFNALTEDMEIIENHTTMIIGELYGVKIVLHSNLSVSFIEEVNLSQSSKTLSLLESTISCFIEGFKYKINSELLEYKIKVALHKNGKIKDIENMTLLDKRCIRDLIELTK